MRRPEGTFKVIKRRSETSLGYLGLTGGFSLFLVVQVEAFPNTAFSSGYIGYNLFMGVLASAFAISYLGTSVSLGIINYVGNTEYEENITKTTALGKTFVANLELWIRIITLSPLVVTWLITSAVMIYAVWHFDPVVTGILGFEGIVCLSLSIVFAGKGHDSTTYRDELVANPAPSTQLVEVSGKNEP